MTIQEWNLGTEVIELIEWPPAPVEPRMQKRDRPTNRSSSDLSDKVSPNK
jgi:hypothetical protein